METPTIERQYKPGELAELLQVPVSTLAQWRNRKIGPKPTVLPGSRLVRYSPSSVKEWLESAASTIGSD